MAGSTQESLGRLVGVAFALVALGGLYFGYGGFGGRSDWTFALGLLAAVVAVGWTLSRR